MAVSGAQLLRVTRHGFDKANYRDTEHFRLYQSLTVDPEDFVAPGGAGKLMGRGNRPASASVVDRHQPQGTRRCQ